MTEEVAVVEEQNPNTEAEAEVVEQAPVEKKQEKMLTQSEVNRIAARTKHDAYEKGRREAMAELEKQRQESQPADQTAGQSSMGGMEQLSRDDIRQLIEEEAQRKAEMAMAQKIAGEFTGKLDAAKSKYEDFEDVLSELDLPSIPHVVQWANELDNTGDVMYDIAKNPAKFANLLTLSATAPHLAQKELRRLSDSIKRNEEAKQSESARDPLSQLKPSTNATDSGKLTISDLRKQPWLRG